MKKHLIWILLLVLSVMLAGCACAMTLEDYLFTSNFLETPNTCKIGETVSIELKVTGDPEKNSTLVCVYTAADRDKTPCELIHEETITGTGVFTITFTVPDNAWKYIVSAQQLWRC